jgi:hypothetical protein
LSFAVVMMVVLALVVIVGVALDRLSVYDAGLLLLAIVALYLLTR